VPKVYRAMTPTSEGRPQVAATEYEAALAATQPGWSRDEK
jgi:hypothetical protein